MAENTKYSTFLADKDLRIESVAPDSFSTGSKITMYLVPQSFANCPILEAVYEPRIMFGEILKNKSDMVFPLNTRFMFYKHFIILVEFIDILNR